MPRRNKRSKRKKRRHDDGYLTQSLFREMARNQVGYEAGYVCYFCGTKTKKRSAQSDPRGFTVDHLTPLSRGGNWDLANLVCACRDCNNRKADMTEAEYLATRSMAG